MTPKVTDRRDKIETLILKLSEGESLSDLAEDIGFLYPDTRSSLDAALRIPDGSLGAISKLYSLRCAIERHVLIEYDAMTVIDVITP